MAAEVMRKVHRLISFYSDGIFLFKAIGKSAAERLRLHVFVEQYHILVAPNHPLGYHGGNAAKALWQMVWVWSVMGLTGIIGENACD